MPSNYPVYHHLIPQTYMSAWCHNEHSLWTYDKAKQKSKARNIQNICGIKYFHSIRAGSLYANAESLNKIWGFLSDYQVMLNGEQINGFEKMNKSYPQFNEWEIFHKNGVKVNKKDRNLIKQRIIQTKDNEIEEQWNVQFENNWKCIAQTLLRALSDIKAKNPVSLTSKTAADIMRYYVMFDWRGFTGNEQFNDTLDFIDKQLCPLSEIEIPPKERQHPMYVTAFEEMRHNLLVRIFDDFLNNTGVMYKQVESYEEHLTFIFLIAPHHSPFITSDNPSFIFENKEGYKEPLLIVLPQLAISLAKKDPDYPNQYKIAELNENEVAYYNIKVFENASALVLSSNQLNPSDYQ